MTELIHGTEEQLSVFTCKAITWEISPLPGVFDDDRADSYRRRTGISDGDRADSWHRGRAFVEADPYQGYPMQS